MPDNATNAAQEALPELLPAGGEAPAAAPEQAVPVEDRPVVIEFKHVSKSYKLYSSDRKRLLGMFSKKMRYKHIHASSDLSFTIRKGERVALFGANGAGKSTVLKMITGVSFPTEGEIVINGRVSALLELKAGFDRNLTGRENIRLRGQIMGLSKEQIAALEPEVVKFAALGDYIDQPMRTYSSGMKSRLGFAFASSVDPDILIVDEALSVGDRRFRAKCRRRVNRMAQDSGTTLLFVTHSTSSARKFCERALVLEKGHLVFDGPIEEAIAFYEGDEEAKEAVDAAEEALETAVAAQPESQQPAAPAASQPSEQEVG